MCPVEAYLGSHGLQPGNEGEAGAAETVVPAVFGQQEPTLLVVPVL